MHNIVLSPVSIDDFIERTAKRTAEILRSEATTKPQREWMDLNELVAYDPEKRSKNTFYSYTQDPDSNFPFHKRGKKILVLKSEFDQWIKSGGKNNRKDIAKKVDEVLTKKATGKGGLS